MKISVIVPAYNSEKFIEETLDCLVNQTLKDIQVIVVNDGSTDSTQAIIDRYAAKDQRIVPVYQENSGVSAARNNGIERAEGDYILFLDSDDLLSTDALEKLYTALKETSADLALFRVQSFGAGVDQYNPVVDELVKEKHISCYDKRLLRNFLVSNKVYSTQLLKDSGVRFPPTRYSEDGAFFMQFVHTVKPDITGVADALFMYRQHSLSVTHRVNSSLISEFSKSMDMVYEVASGSFEDAPDKKEEYLQEILFKDYLALMNEFYRMLWKAEDEDSLRLIGERCDSLTARMTQQTKSRCALEVKDIGKPVFSKAEICDKPFVSVVAKLPSDEFIESLYAQSMPLFELITKPSANLPEKANIITDTAQKPKGRIVLKFKGNEVLDRRLLKVVSLLKRSAKFGFLPDSVIKLGAILFLKLKR